MSIERRIYFTLMGTAVAFGVITFLLAIGAVTFYALGTETFFQLMRGYALVFGIGAGGIFFGTSLYFINGAPPATPKLTRAQKSALDVEYVQRFNDPEYQEFIEGKLDNG